MRVFLNSAGLQDGKRGMRLSLTSCVEVAKRVFMEDTIDEDDIECMACSLIDQVSKADDPLVS